MTSFIHLALSPLWQGAATATLMAGAVLVHRAFWAPGESVWTVAVAPVALFTLFNAVAFVFVEGAWRYGLLSALLVVLLTIWGMVCVSVFGNSGGSDEASMVFLAPLIWWPGLMLLSTLARVARHFLARPS